eukprot:scaffold161330_cov67-Cyclotella_meneghiniana.AAC.1
MHFSSLIFSLAVFGGSTPSAFAQTKRLAPVVRERRGPKAKLSGTIRSGSRTHHKKKALPEKQAEFGNTAQFIKEENTLPLKEDKGGFLKSDAGYDYGMDGYGHAGYEPYYDDDYFDDYGMGRMGDYGHAGYGPHGSHMSGPHGGHMSGPPGSHMSGPHGGHMSGPHGGHMSGPPHGGHMSGPHYPEMSYDYDYDYDYYGSDGYEPHGHGPPHGVEPMSHEEARYVFCTSLTFFFACNPTFSLPLLQHRAIMHIASHCPSEVMAMDECYGGQDFLMMCTNCIWEGLLGSGMNCTELEVDYERCSEVCVAQCDDEVSAVYECGLERICEGGGLDDYLDDYLMSYGPDSYGYEDDTIPPMSDEEASYVL